LVLTFYIYEAYIRKKLIEKRKKTNIKHAQFTVSWVNHLGKKTFKKEFFIHKN